MNLLGDLCREFHFQRNVLMMSFLASPGVRPFFGSQSTANSFLQFWVMHKIESYKINKRMI